MPPGSIGPHKMFALSKKAVLFCPVTVPPLYLTCGDTYLRPLTPRSLKILQAIFAEPAPVKTFRSGGGRGVPSAAAFFQQRTIEMHQRNTTTQLFFQLFSTLELAPLSASIGS